MRKLTLFILIFVGALFNQGLGNSKSVIYETKKETTNSLFKDSVDSLHLTDSLFRDSIIAFASKYEGCRYVWGAIGPNSFDCSGFTSFIMKKFNYKHINRTAKDQYKQGITKSIDDAKPGDLIFFSSRGLFVGHVGMITGKDDNGVLTFIHAASSKSGVIFSKLTGYYSKRFVGIKDIVTQK